jgi:hypothetical protein
MSVIREYLYHDRLISVVRDELQSEHIVDTVPIEETNILNANPAPAPTGDAKRSNVKIIETNGFSFGINISKNY